MRTTIYVDGFNLYYRALKGTPYRWLDLLALSQQLLKPQNQITRIRYFTARVKPNTYSPDQHVRQDAYMQAITAHIPCLTIHEGRFSSHVCKMALAYPKPGGPRSAEVIKPEEKGSDVNLAVHLVNDAWENGFDAALVISNDSDLAGAIHLATARGKPVGVANPNTDKKRPMTAELYAAASFRRRVEEKHLKAAQLPPSFPAIGISKPARWY